MDRFASIAAFVKAIDLGSFAAAAANLGMSAPMVGKHVQSLEDRLGVRLVNRTTRRQNLTPAGRIYYDRCRQILADMEAADTMAAEERNEPRGQLRMTLPVHFGRQCVAPIMLGYAAKHSGLELDISFTDRIVDLESEGVDLAVRTGSLENRTDLTARLVARQAMVVCASPAYIEEHGTPRFVADLADHQAITIRRRGRTRQWLFPDGQGAVEEIVPPASMHLDDLAAIADAVEAGLGIAWLPAWLIRERIAGGALHALLEDRLPYLYEVHAVWPSTPYLPRKVRLAIDLLADALPRAMPSV